MEKTPKSFEEIIKTSGIPKLSHWSDKGGIIDYLSTDPVLKKPKVDLSQEEILALLNIPEELLPKVNVILDKVFDSKLLDENKVFVGSIEENFHPKDSNSLDGLKKQFPEAYQALKKICQYRTGLIFESNLNSLKESEIIHIENFNQTEANLFVAVRNHLLSQEDYDEYTAQLNSMLDKTPDMVSIPNVRGTFPRTSYNDKDVSYILTEITGEKNVYTSPIWKAFNFKVNLQPTDQRDTAKELGQEESRSFLTLKARRLIFTFLSAIMQPEYTVTDEDVKDLKTILDSFREEHVEKRGEPWKFSAVEFDTFSEKLIEYVEDRTEFREDFFDDEEEKVAA